MRRFSGRIAATIIRLAAMAVVAGWGAVQPGNAAPPRDDAAPAPVCAPGVELGATVAIPLTRWRPDQKEPAVREAIAQRAVEAALPGLPCARSVSILPITASVDETTRLEAAKAAGAETALVIRLTELGPVMVLSFPALWSTWSDVQFTLDVVSLQTGETLRSIPHQRRKGGAFQSRGLEPLQGEMERALKDVLLGTD